MGTAVTFHEAAAAGRPMIQGFLDGSFDEVWVIYAEFLSISKQVPVIKKLLPIPPPEKAEAGEPAEPGGYLPEHIAEPSAAELLGEMLAAATCSFSFTAHCLKPAPASTRHAWWPWTTPPGPATTC